MAFSEFSIDHVTNSLCQLADVVESKPVRPMEHEGYPQMPELVSSIIQQVRIV